jgi:hypothetical protein
MRIITVLKNAPRDQSTDFNLLVKLIPVLQAWVETSKPSVTLRRGKLNPPRTLG